MRRLEIRRGHTWRWGGLVIFSLLGMSLTVFRSAPPSTTVLVRPLWSGERNLDAVEDSLRFDLEAVEHSLRFGPGSPPAGVLALLGAAVHGAHSADGDATVQLPCTRENMTAVPCAHGRIIAAQLTGGLGNQLFVSAAAIAYALRNDASVLLCRPDERDKRANSTKSLRHTVFARLLTAEFTVGDVVAASSVRGIVTSAVYQSGSFASYSALPSLAKNYGNNEVVSLVGYFQHAAYFDPEVSSTVRSLFGPPLHVARRIHHTYPNLLNAVAVHIRRGDYVTDASVLLHSEYYERALRTLFQVIGGDAPPHVFVLSDDLPWVWAQPFFAALREQRGASGIEEPDALEAMWFLSLVGRGLVCPNSTFCWWAAWLGNAGKYSRRPVVLPAWWATGLPNREELGFYPSWALVINNTI